jgi:hypothetical protein
MTEKELHEDVAKNTAGAEEGRLTKHRQMDSWAMLRGLNMTNKKGTLCCQTFSVSEWGADIR